MQYANLDIDLILMFSTVFHFHCAQKHSLPCRRVALRLVSNTFRHSYDSLGCTAILNGATRSDMKVMKHQTGVFGKHESQVDVESGWIKCIWRRSSEEKSSSAFKAEDVWGQKIISDPILCISEQCGDESSPVFSIMLCSKVLSENNALGECLKKEMRANEWGWTVFCLRPTKYHLSFLRPARNNTNSISPVERSALRYWFLSGKLLWSGALGVTRAQRRPLGLFTGWPRSRTAPVSSLVR